MGLRKNLTPIGTSHGVIIDKPILEMLGIGRDSVVDLEVKDGALVIRPVAAPLDAKGAKRAKVREAGKRFMKAHARTFKKLAK